MGRSAYWNFRGAGIASHHWATRTAVRVPGHDPRLALGSARRTDPPERRASLVLLWPGSASPYHQRRSVLLSVAVGYLLLALAAVLFVAAVFQLLAYRRRNRNEPDAPVPDEASGTHQPAGLFAGLARARDATSVGRTLLDEVIAILGVEFAAVALISDDGKDATGLVARADGKDVQWWPSITLDLENEPSAVASAVFEAAPLTIFDVESSPRVNRRLADRVGAKSAAFVPVISASRVLAVVIAASTSGRRAFTPDEVARLEALAGEASLALEKTRSAAQLEEALERERLVVAIGQRVRSEHDVEALLRVAVEEVGKATNVVRCFIRLGEPGEPTPVRAEWDAPGVDPLTDGEPNLLVTNLAIKERRTVASGDIENDPQLQDPALGRVDNLVGLDVRAGLATPIIVFDRVIGAFGLHRAETTEWTQSEISLAEAVARKVGLAVHTARLLEENRRRLDRQAALVQAAQVMTSELEVETVLQRLVVEVTKLLEADAADCYLHDARRGVLRCAAVYGLPPELVDFEFPADRALAGEAMRRRQAVVSGEYHQEIEGPHAAYEGFTGAMVAPMTWWGEVRGVLGVGTRDPERRFSAEDVEVLEAFASLGSVALRNVASIEQTIRQVRIQRGFFRIASVLAQPLSLDETLDAVAQAASEALGGSFAAVLMPGEQGLALAGSYGLPAEVAEFLRRGLGDAEPLHGGALRKRVLASPELASDDRFGKDWRKLAESAGFRSLVAVPVEAPRREQTGVGIVFFAEELAALAANVSAFLSNAELYQRVVLERERSMAILGNVADGIVAVDREGDVVLWNAAAEEITGCPAAEALGRPPADVLQRSLDPDETSAEGRGLIQVRRGEDEVWLSVSEAIMRDPAGAVAGRIYAFRDVSADRLVEQLKSGFVSTVSHELRAPLTSIYGFAETLLRDDIAFGEQERLTFLRYIASEAQRLTGIVDALLSVAQLEAGDLQVQFAPTDLREVVSDVVETAERELANGRRFIVQVPEEPLDASADRDKVRQILTNLVDNAVKFSPDGGTVTVAARRTHDAVQVRVVDEGTGVPQSEQERIFRKFYRAESTMPVPEGTGLGLFIARGLASAMGGRVWVDSDTGTGGCFVFELPCSATAAVEERE